VNILVLDPGREACECTYYGNDDGAPLVGRIPDCRDAALVGQHLRQLTARMGEADPAVRHGEPDVIGVRAAYGGSTFRHPVVAAPRVLAQIEALVPEAPLHLPLLLCLLRFCREEWPDVPAVVVFDTSFFVGLPAREHCYALDFELMQRAGLRRYGFHGILHQAAVRHVRWPGTLGDGPKGRFLSVCLDAQPEIAAVVGRQPLMVTGGATPLEGIPGETTSGELDPSITIQLAHELGWGPEQINAVLTRESGLYGLAGRHIGLAALFGTEDESLCLAREVIRHRMLLTCGAGMAAMGGVDAVVFSGRSAHVGRRLGPWLSARLRFRGGQGPVMWECFGEPLPRIIADIAVAEGIGAGTVSCAGQPT